MTEPTPNLSTDQLPTRRSRHQQSIAHIKMKKSNWFKERSPPQRQHIKKHSRHLENSRANDHNNQARSAGPCGHIHGNCVPATQQLLTHTMCTNYMRQLSAGTGVVRAERTFERSQRCVHGVRNLTKDATRSHWLHVSSIMCTNNNYVIVDSSKCKPKRTVHKVELCLGPTLRRRNAGNYRYQLGEERFRKVIPIGFRKGTPSRTAKKVEVTLPCLDR
jgi:hypothetical protein